MTWWISNKEWLKYVRKCSKTINVHVFNTSNGEKEKVKNILLIFFFPKLGKGSMKVHLPLVEHFKDDFIFLKYKEKKILTVVCPNFCSTIKVNFFFYILFFLFMWTLFSPNIKNEQTNKKTPVLLLSLYLVPHRDVKDIRFVLKNQSGSRSNSSIG